MLKPCQHRSVSEQGQLLCAKIKGPDSEVSPDICNACPVSSADCSHLRFTLEKRGGGDIVVRFGNGRTEVWKGEPEGVHVQQAACALMVLPISPGKTCIACAWRRPAGDCAERTTEPAVTSARPGNHVRPSVAGG